MAIVVSDTSPIRALHHLNLIALLPQLFDEVILPSSVLRELENPRPRFKAITQHDIPFARVVAAIDSSAVLQLRAALDAGEAEAIVIAAEIHADRILIDENAGRKIARKRGLRALGVLGLLVRAKRLGMIPAFTPLLDRLQNELGFFVSERIRLKMIRQAQEGP